MKKNLYYATVFRRSNVIKDALLGFFMTIASYPRLLLEVFVRKNFGERYFSLASAITVAVIVGAIPILVNSVGRYSRFDFGDLITDHFTWYIFLAAFLVMAFKRQREVDREPSVFDFARFSLSTGQVHPKFYELKIFNKKEGSKVTKIGPDDRQISILLEPLLFFGIGLLLALMHQLIGVLIIVASICYSLSYVAAYRIGDNFVMDKIDELICSEELTSSFVEGRDPSQTRGFNAYGRKPADPDMRRKVAETFFEQESEFEVS